MRKLFSTQEAYKCGITHDALKWGVRRGTWQRVCRGVYLQGSQPPTSTEKALAVVIATGGVASGSLAGVLHELDSIDLVPPFVTIRKNGSTRRREVISQDLRPENITEIKGFKCTNGLRTLLDLAKTIDDVTWEQVLESALRKQLLKIEDLAATRNKRVQRVLRMRPDNAPATGSLLETLMVQLIRDDKSLPEPSRQVEVFNQWGEFVARVDLAWPNEGVFLELDGQQHKGQPVYDARRETAVVASTGWLPGRFTWYEVNHVPRSTLRRCCELFKMATK